MLRFRYSLTSRAASFLVGPPVGGALYTAFGYRGPFIFGIIVTFIDFIGRLVIIERKDAMLYGQDNWVASEVSTPMSQIAVSIFHRGCIADRHGWEGQSTGTNQ